MIITIWNSIQSNLRNRHLLWSRILGSHDPSPSPSPNFMFRRMISSAIILVLTTILWLKHLDVRSDVHACEKTMTHAIRWKEGKSFLPLSNHEGKKIFDYNRLCTYISKEDQPFTCQNSQEIFIHGSTIKEFISSFTAKLGISIGDPLDLAKAEFSITYSDSTSNITEMKYSQYRHLYIYKTIQLPEPTLDHTNCRLCDLLTNEARKDLKNITNYKKAEQFINAYGLYYSRKLYLGGCVIASHSESSTSTTTSQALQAKLEAKVNSTAITSNGIATNSSTSETQKSGNVMVQVIGGSPRIYRTKGLDEWSKTIQNDGNNNLAIIRGDLEPIFKLAPNEQIEFHLKNASYQITKNTQELGKLYFTAKPESPIQCTVTAKDSSKVSLQAIYSESHTDGFTVKLQNLNGENHLDESQQNVSWLLKILDEKDGENSLTCLIMHSITNELLGIHGRKKKLDLRKGNEWIPSSKYKWKFDISSLLFSEEDVLAAENYKSYDFWYAVSYVKSFSKKIIVSIYPNNIGDSGRSQVLAAENYKSHYFWYAVSYVKSFSKKMIVSIYPNNMGDSGTSQVHPRS